MKSAKVKNYPIQKGLLCSFASGGNLILNQSNFPGTATMLSSPDN